MIDPDTMACDGEEIGFRDRDQGWVGVWHPPDLPAPSGTRHGSAAICFTFAGEIVLVSSDGETWGSPGGRPDGDEDWCTTLDREVHEEACARIVDAGLLGFTTGEVVNGPEKGLVLVRAVWSAVVALDEWKPLHEIRHRILVPPNEVMGRLDLPPDRVRIARRWLYEAMKQRGRD